MASSKKGFSAHQLHRTIGVTYKTAWFMFHRLREAMTTEPEGKMGSVGGTVEADKLTSARSAIAYLFLFHKFTTEPAVILPRRHFDRDADRFSIAEQTRHGPLFMNFLLGHVELTDARGHFQHGAIRR